jgi:Cys-tRNA(Pro)/Cys-tRNA(Cys) deacylase
MENTTPVSQALERAGIPYSLFKHPGPIHSLEQAAIERGQRPEQVVRSILFRLGGGEFAMVLIAGPSQVSWPALRRHFKQSRLTMASEEEVRAETGYEKGAVSPVGIPPSIQILIDDNVLVEEEISIGSGVRGITVILKSRDLLSYLQAYQTGRFQQGSE